MTKEPGYNADGQDLDCRIESCRTDPGTSDFKIELQDPVDFTDAAACLNGDHEQGDGPFHAMDAEVAGAAIRTWMCRRCRCLYVEKGASGG